MIRTLAAVLVFVLAGALLAEEKEGGIIGTGVIGQVTGLEQFEVSGMRFDFAPDIELKGVNAVEDLRMGMTLVLSTGRNGAAWEINSLQHTPLLTGPITGPGEVMGVPVEGSLPTEGFVQIDGFWSEVGVVSSRITSVPNSAVQVTGIYNGNGHIGLVPVQGLDVSDEFSGQTLAVSGQFQNGAVSVDAVTEGHFMGASPDLVLLEGIFQPTASQDALVLQGVAVAKAVAEPTAGSGELVRRCALRGRTDFPRDELTASDEAMVRSFCVSASN